MTSWRSFYQTRSEVREQDEKRLGTLSLPNRSWPSYRCLTRWKISYPKGSKGVHLYLKHGCESTCLVRQARESRWNMWPWEQRHVEKQPTHGIKLQVCVCVYPIMQVHEHMNGASHYKFNYRDTLFPYTTLFRSTGWDKIRHSKFAQS